MPSTAGIVASGSAQLDQWLRANLVAFDERRSSPLVNLGTLGAAGNATATGTRRLVNTGTKAFVWIPGTTGNGLSVAALALAGAASLQVDFDITPDNLTSGFSKQLAGQLSGSAETRGWQLYSAPTALGFAWSPDGTNFAPGSTVTYGALGFGVGTVRGRMIWRGNNGSGNWDVRWYSLTAEGVATLVSTTTGSGTSSIFNSTQPVEIGGRVGFVTDNFPMAVHSVFISVDGVLQRGIDPSVLTDEGASSFTATTGQTVTVNRGTSTGYRSEVVLPGSGSRLLNGTSDLLEVTDNAALNFGAGQSFTPWMLLRQWGTPVSSGPLISKRSLTSPNAGWTLANFGAASTLQVQFDDGPNLANRANASLTAGALNLAGFVADRSAQTLRLQVDATAGASTSISAVGSVASSVPVVVARNSDGTGFQHLRLYAWGVYPGALTAAQWAALRDALLVPERTAA